MTEEEMRTRVAGVVLLLIIIILIVLIIVPGKEGPQGSKGLPGATGPSGYSEAEMGPMGDTGPTGPTGTVGIIGYNKWVAVELQGQSTTLPYPGAINYINYYWNSNSSSDLYLLINGAGGYKIGDIFTITNLNTHAKIYLRPNSFQNISNYSGTDYWLKGGNDNLNTALIIITGGYPSDADKNPLLINISYSMITTLNVSTTNSVLI
jgi:hypothetical protein